MSIENILTIYQELDSLLEVGELSSSDYGLYIDCYKLLKLNGIKI